MQILSPPPAAILTEGVTGPVTVNAMELDVAVVGEAQLAFEVSTNEITSPFTGVELT